MICDHLYNCNISLERQVEVRLVAAAVARAWLSRGESSASWLGFYPTYGCLSFDVSMLTGIVVIIKG